MNIQHNILRTLIKKVVTPLSLPIIWIGLVTTANAVQPPPLTLDPTYGRAIPKRASEPKSTPDATWIWTDQTRDNQTIYVRRQFLLSKIPRHAMLYITADNEFVAYANGKMIGQTPSIPGDHDLWKKVQAVDVASQLHSGMNVIAIRAHNEGGAAGVLVRLVNDAQLALVSDKNWKVNDKSPAEKWEDPDYNDAGWSAATEEGRVGEGAW